MEGVISEPYETVKSICTELEDIAGYKIKLHQKKIEEVRLKIEQIDAENSTVRGVQQNSLLQRETLQEKLHELNLQQIEFLRFVRGLQDRLKTCALNPNLNVCVTQCRAEFQLELERFERALPMYARKSDVLEAIGKQKVCIILGETGSGKSTQILQYVHSAGFHERGIVVCTQPRKVAAVSLARRVYEEMGYQLGLVGSKVGTQSNRNRETKLLYVTDHLLLNECLKDPLLSKYSVIIVDEAHERSIYSDLLLGFLKLALPKRNDLSVVIMSATINPDLFVSYFSSSSMSGNKPPVLRVSGRAFPVDVYYEKSSEDYMKAAYLKALNIHRTEPAGDILVFLTSPIETEKACKYLMSQCGKDAAAIQALELHGRLQMEDQQKIFAPTPADKRKIVFATNSAETSITIPGIKYVIDTGRVKEVSYDAKRNMNSLNVQWVTKSSAEQRKGRAGRTDCGKCYRLYTKEEFNEMREQSVPEILRIHLGQALLKLMTLGISNPMDFDFVEAPATDAVESALSVLRDLGACNENGITEVGKKLAKITLEPRLGKVVLLGIERQIPLDAAVMAAVCTVGGSIFFRSGTEKEKQQADRKKTRFCDEWGDVVTLVNVYKEWIMIPEKTRNKWCVENSINAKSMRAAKDIVADIQQTFKVELCINIPTVFPESDFAEADDANEKMARILYECYFSNLSRFSGLKREGFLLASIPSTVMHLHPSSALTYIEELPTWVVYEQVLTTSKTFLLNATFVKEEWVREWISSGKTKQSLDDLLSYVLSPLPVQHIGSQCISSLLSKKAESKRQLEAKVRGKAADAKCYVDIVSLEGRNNNGGTLTMYSTPKYQIETLSLMESHLHDVRQSLAKECIEDRLVPNSDVRFVLERGGQIRTILMPGDSRVVRVKMIPGIELTETAVDSTLSQFGDIERIKRDAAQDGIWGTVMFKVPESAKNALNSTVASPIFRLESSTQHATASAERAGKFQHTVKVTATRRALRGYGYVQLNGNASAVVGGINRRTFLIRKVRGQGSELIGEVMVQVDRKTTNQLYIKSLPMWADENIIKTSLGVEIVGGVTNVKLLRENAPANDQQMCDDLERTLKNTLRGSGITDSDYRVSIKKPPEKSPYYFAYINFCDSATATRGAVLFNDVFFNKCQMDACLLLKTSFFLPQAVKEFCVEHLQEKINDLQKAARGNVRADQPKVCKYSVVVAVEATCSDDLVLVRQKLAPLLSGHKLELNRQQLALMQSKVVTQQLRDVESRMGVKIHVDERQSSALLYASNADVAAQAEQCLYELMSASMPDVSKDISLQSADYPKGIMKALVVQYGPNLEWLQQESGVYSLDLILRQHTIRVQGGKEAYEKLLELIRKKAKEILDRQAASSECPDAANPSSRFPECPVCFDSADPNAFYVSEYCNHVYCRGCATALVDNAVRSNDVPVRCCFETCTETLALQDFRNLLDGKLGRLYDTAVRSFMSANGDRYSHCITPDCRMIYRRAPPGKSGEEFHCSECQVTLCTACNAAAHPGFNCVKSEGAEINDWIEEDRDNRCVCPKCGIRIEKDGGCMRMTCQTCRVHFCWHCKEQFDTSQLCYAHLAKLHGGFF